MQHKSNTNRIPPWKLASPRYQAQVQAKDLNRRKARLTRSHSIQIAIVAHFRTTIAPALRLPPYALFGQPSYNVPRSWVGAKIQVWYGFNTRLPHLYLPLMSHDRTHSCLWLQILTPNCEQSAGARFVANQLHNLGHATVTVRNVAQAQASILDYLQGPITGP